MWWRSAVDVIRAEYGDQLGTEVADEVQVLEDGVRRALVPGLPARICGGDGDERLGEPAADAPGPAHVLDQRLRLVLHEDVQGVDPRVDEVAQDVVDDAMAGAERDGGLAARAGERLEAVARPPPSRSRARGASAAIRAHPQEGQGPMV
jgi:hypothetical protein